MEEDRCLNNWDLHAVVRLACRRRLSPQLYDPFHSFPPLPPQQGPPAAVNPANEQQADAGWCFPDLRAGRGQDGDELLGALLAAAQHPMPPPALPTPPPPPATQQQPVTVTQAEVPAPAPAAPASAPPARPQPRRRQMPRSKRRCRKNQVKKVACRVPADGSSSDVWAWRKYGQKPIKGSPYPRGYYRCSSSKGCAARKQVERCRTDPDTFILTYNGEHNHAAPTHRNSLAGTTRYKFPSTESPPPSVVVGSSESQQQQPSPSAPSTSVEDDDEDELLVEDMEEMAGFDELLFLNGDAADSAAPMETLFDVVDEPFLGSLWASTPAGSPAAVAAGAGS